jgi:hypothetical protein
MVPLGPSTRDRPPSAGTSEVVTARIVVVVVLLLLAKEPTPRWWTFAFGMNAKTETIVFKRMKRRILF